ncbi:MAG: dipeptidase [Flavobacteriia bacterium]|nr:dipeptidase [Flavobacteriia bacterium]
MSKYESYIESNKDQMLEELIDLLKIPSISADPAYKGDVEKTAQVVANHLISAGADNVTVEETPGYPVVYGEKMVSPDAPTVLVYGHYDVQPPDPIELWDSPPFEPVIKKTDLHPEGAIFARGACDDKGQFFMHVKAFESMMQNGGSPVNVKFMIEGEEEVGSANLGWYVARNREKLACDVILISDTGMIGPDTPSITTGLRGLSYVEVKVTGPNRDLHSGLYGGAVANPINILSKMIGSLHDENNHITVEGFYDKVQDVSDEERAGMAKAPFSEEAYKKALDLSDTWGEKGYSTIERASIRPTLDVNGIWGGYTGEGAKTVIASWAKAKISMRLVPDQDPNEITDIFLKHFTKIAPSSVKVEVTPHHGGEPYVTGIDHPGYRAAATAMKASFGKDAIPMRSGGSIPILSLFERELGAKSILMGFGLDSDAIHSPNEHYGVRNYFMGIKTIPLWFEAYAEEMKG